MAIQLTVKDNEGTTLWWSGEPQVMKWNQIFIISSADTKLPWNIDVDPSKLELTRLKRRDTNGTSHEHIAVPPPSNTWRMFDVGIIAGPSEWTSESTDEATLPYCSVGDWDDGDFWDFVDPFLPGGREHWSTRDMDCYFEC